jgi:hypothetical protein
MKKVIGIYSGGYSDNFWNEESILNEGGGGSETWAVQLAQEFQKLGFHVIVFGNPEMWCFSLSGVEYLPKRMFKERIKYQRFDYFIFSRDVSELTPELSCSNVYIMSHDICLHNAEKYEDLKMDRVKKIAYLSSWHKWALSDWYKHEFNEKDSFKTINGVDSSYYNDVVDESKKNKMVWSSRSERGLLYLLDWVFPKIKQKIPDFEIDVCLYLSDFDSKFHKDIKGVNFLGKVGKEELSRRQKESKIWIYPNLGFLDSNGSPFQETFCITAVENGLAKNAILTSKLGGIIDTLDNYEFFLGEKIVERGKWNNGCIAGSEKLKQYADELANNAITFLENDNLRRYVSYSTYNTVKKYTWHNAAITWLKEWNFF